MKRKTEKISYIKALLVVIAVAAVIVSALLLVKQYRITLIDSFDDCVKAGLPVMETYPEQCRANGQVFVRK